MVKVTPSKFNLSMYDFKDQGQILNLIYIHIGWGQPDRQWGRERGREGALSDL